MFTGVEIVAGFAYKIQILDSGKKDLGNFGHINVFFTMIFCKYEKFAKLSNLSPISPALLIFSNTKDIEGRLVH